MWVFKVLGKEGGNSLVSIINTIKTRYNSWKIKRAWKRIGKWKINEIYGKEVAIYVKSETMGKRKKQSYSKFTSEKWIKDRIGSLKSIRHCLQLRQTFSINCWKTGEIW